PGDVRPRARERARAVRKRRASVRRNIAAVNRGIAGRPIVGSRHGIAHGTIRIERQLRDCWQAYPRGRREAPAIELVIEQPELLRDDAYSAAARPRFHGAGSIWGAIS